MPPAGGPPRPGGPRPPGQPPVPPARNRPADSDDEVPTSLSPAPAPTGVRPPPYLGDDQDGDAIRPSANPQETSRLDSESERPLAYSASAAAASRNVRADKFDDDLVTEDPVPPRPRSDSPNRRAPRGRTAPKGTNRLAIWAMVLSFLGITAPIGLFLGYRARNEISRTREYGEPFARVAIWIGWFYIIVLILGLLLYFWIAGQGS